MPTVLIVDDHHLVRTGLRNILSSDPSIEVVGEADSGEEAVRLARSLMPNIILMDIGLRGMSGLEATERILKFSPQVRIIALTTHSQPPFPANLLEAGASGYLTKASDADELLKAIRAVNRGERYIGADIAQQLAVALLPGSSNSPFDDLSAREMEVALMLMKGLKLPAIGEVLSLSPKTVATYKYRVYNKVAVKSAVELMREALRFGVINAQDD